MIAGELHMPVRGTSSHYGIVAITLHWLIALLIFTNIGLGIYFNEILDAHDTLRRVLIPTHESIGLTVLVLSLARLAWRLVNPVPTPPADISREMKRLAHFVHYLLYFLMIAVPLLGWMMVSTSRSGAPISYFGLLSWPKIGFIFNMTAAQKSAYGGVFEDSHIILAFLLLALALGHVAAALYHHFVRRDVVLQRMLTGSDIPA
jgi:cytochrome b561